MKKAVSLLTAICILAALCACGPAAESVSPALPPAATGQGTAGSTPREAPVSSAPVSPAAQEGIQVLTFAEAAEAVRAEPGAVHLFAANVGKGDAIVLKAGDWTGLVDTGKTWARGRVIAALGLMGLDTDEKTVDGIFLTHTDDDHVGGLRWMTQEGASGITAGTVYASAMFTGVKDGKHPALNAANVLTDKEVSWLRRGDEVPMGDSGAVLRVLAPASRYDDKDDNNSLVMMLESSQGRILLAGDMELVEEDELLGFKDDLSCCVLKVPNHGDDDTTSAEFANACAAQVAVVSTSEEEKPGTPDPAVIDRMSAAGSTVVVTEDSGLGILIMLREGKAEVRYVDFPNQPPDCLFIGEIDVTDDRITLENSGSSAVGLGGMYLYSEKGNEVFVIPDGVLMEPGTTLTIGTNSTKGSYDLLWDDEKVVKKKKTDAFYLYDPFGQLVDWTETGL